MTDNADIETLAELLAAHHWSAEVSPPEGVNPYLWCVCGWRSDDATDAHWASGEHARLAHAHVAAFVEAHVAARIVLARAGEGALRERIEALADDLRDSAAQARRARDTYGDTDRQWSEYNSFALQLDAQERPLRAALDPEATT